ncbi:hypothetical protein [Xanthomonas cassavae]
MFMVEPVASRTDRIAADTPPAQLRWRADSPLDPAVQRFRGAACYQVWQRGQHWTAVAEGAHWSAALAPRGWALRYRQWPLLGKGGLLAVLAAGMALAGAQAWSLSGWAVLLVAELVLRVRAGRHAGRWRSDALQRDGWQPVTRLRAISVADAVTTAQIRAARPQR